MNLDDFIIICFCTIDEMLPTVTKGKRLRERGPMPKQADTEVVTIEVVGTYLGLSQDQEVFDYFRRHYAHFFPSMAQIDRTTCVRQAANLWVVKERLWCLIRDHLLLYDPTVIIVDSMPIPVCQFVRPTAAIASTTPRALAKIIPVGRPSTAFACICGCVGQASSPRCTWLLPMCMRARSPGI